jgi:hypothetical protein
MSTVQIGHRTYEMPPREGISVAPGYLQLANIWMSLNVGGGPTLDKPTVKLCVPDHDKRHQR